MDFNSVLSQLRSERDKVDAAISTIEGLLNGNSSSVRRGRKPGPKPKKVKTKRGNGVVWTKAMKAKKARQMKAYWASVRKAKKAKAAGSGEVKS